MKQNEVNEKLTRPYDHLATEDRIYKLWETSGLFNPDECISRGYTKDDAKTFTIMMPPPNVTGVLHMGHGLMLTVEDIMVRYKRMQGFRTLWLPGTDHAAIATQSKVEKEIQKKEGLSRHDLGREELLRRVREFAQDSHDTIVSQVKKMGSSCDWSREAFTLDDTRNHAVNTIFKMMYDDGLIYRGHRIVNWDPKGQTTIADDEIVYEERKGKLYTFKYSHDFPISISTTRPETKIGDVAVAVHPLDERYSQYVGKTYEGIDFCGAKINIKVVADESVEKDFGTGALGVTPAHSMIDWEIADRHNLPRPQVINEYAKMVTESELLNGKKVAEARELVVAWLRENNLLEKEEDVSQNIGTAERTGGIIEPLPKLQWFINVNKPFKVNDSKIDGVATGTEVTLKDLMRTVVESGQIKIIPEHFDKTYFNWINNLRDWCISRQIWYGHRIPVYYKDKDVFVGEKAPDTSWKQDEDTLDTWFSSGIWTFSTLGWPNKSSDLEIYHPTDVLETGYEILFFWVARMIMMTGYALNTIPFHTVYLHGTVRDAQGRKMSKSLGNGIDPIEVAEKFGADAGRMAVIFGSAPGIDSRISWDKIKGQRNFANKIWNIGRFIMTNTDEEDMSHPLNEADQAIMNEFRQFVAEVTKELDSNLLHISAEKIYGYIWNKFASEILESSKAILGEDGAAANSRRALLRTIYEDSLRVLHPFMPFVTEELWSILGKKDLLLVEKWPT